MSCWKNLRSSNTLNTNQVHESDNHLSTYNTEPVMDELPIFNTELVVDELPIHNTKLTINELPTFNTKPIPTSQYFNKADKAGPFTLYVNPDIERSALKELSIQQNKNFTQSNDTVISLDNASDLTDYDLENQELFQKNLYNEHLQKLQADFNLKNKQNQSLKPQGPIQRTTTYQPQGSTPQIQRTTAYQPQEPS